MKLRAHVTIDTDCRGQVEADEFEKRIGRWSLSWGRNSSRCNTVSSFDAPQSKSLKGYSGATSWHPNSLGQSAEPYEGHLDDLSRSRCGRAIFIGSPRHIDGNANGPGGLLGHW
jgi:hypothetical protein